MAMTNTPDKSEMLPCPFCGAATTLPPNTPYIRHPPNGCYFANHNIRFQNWQKRASSQAPSDDVKARNLTRMQDGRIMTDEEIARAAIPPKPAIPSAVPSDDVVEQVARAISRATSVDLHGGKLTDYAADDWRDFEGEARAAIAALQAVPTSGEVGWQPIESAPKDGMPVLLGYFRENLDGSIYQEGGAPVVAAWIPTKKLADDGAEVNWVSLGERLRSSRSFSPTHWHPLPAPPTLKASGEE